jgi:DNA-binding NtrC family response regulator
LGTLIAEILAAKILDPDDSTTEEDAKRVETIGDEAMQKLKSRSWHWNFTELRRIVNDAVRLGKWPEAIELNPEGRIPLRGSAGVFTPRQSKYSPRLVEKILQLRRRGLSYAQTAIKLSAEEQEQDRLNVDQIKGIVRRG